MFKKLTILTMLMTFILSINSYAIDIIQPLPTEKFIKSELGIEERHDFDFTFDENDITIKSGMLEYQARSMLRGVLKEYSQDFINAEDKYNINAAFLISLARLESGNGTYSLMDRNNIFSFAAYDDDIYQAVEFESIPECIDYVAKYLSDEYLSEDGKYYNGVSIYDMNIYYSSDAEWADKIITIINK
jgi:beta-N-acetylglucosaminidase